MKIPFFKYQGTGNDFVLIDNRQKLFDPSRTDLVQAICNRRFGIGSDGLMLLQDKQGFDFEMIFFNPDGSKSLCGNGSRCIVEFAKSLNIINEKASFITYDGAHEAFLKNGIVSLKMNDVSSIEQVNKDYFLNTGSPHYCVLVKDIEQFDVITEGRKIRFNERFRKEGTNVNFLEKRGDAVFVRTYERGVEDETLSCGTGVTASALVASLANISSSSNDCKIQTRGGNLKVRFERKSNNSFVNIWLEGPALFVYKGEIEI